MTVYMHPGSSRGRRICMCLDLAEVDDQQIRIQAMSAGRDMKRVYYDSKCRILVTVEELLSTGRTF